MAHFAIIDDNNLVTNVVVVNNEDIMHNGIESEWKGVGFLTKLFGPGKYVQTSFNNKIRKNFAGPGYYYDEQMDAFISPQPFASWVLNTDKCIWEAPVPYPSDGRRYIWFESGACWVAAKYQFNNK